MSIVWRGLWCVAFWAIAVRILRNVSPVSIDGSGPMPSLYWTRLPTPGIGEYYRHRASFDGLYARPYHLAALAITVAGCVLAPYFVAKIRRSGPRVFARTTGLTLALMLLLAIGSDVGSRLQWWESPLFLMHGYWQGYTVYVLSKLFVPLPLLAGLGNAVIAKMSNAQKPSS